MVPASERREWLLKCSLDRATVDAYEAGLLNLIHTTSIAATSSGSSTNKRSIHIGGSSNRQRARQAAAAKSALQAAVWRGIPPQMRRQLYFYFSGAEGLLRAATAAEASPANPSKIDPKSDAKSDVKSVPAPASATATTPVDPPTDPTIDPPVDPPIDRTTDPPSSQSSQLSPTSPRDADGGRAATQTEQAAADPIDARSRDAAEADDEDDDSDDVDEDDGTHPPRKKRELEHEYYCRKLASLGRICSPDVEQIRRDVCRTAGRHMTVVSTAEGQAALQVGVNE
jgi:hypothetical protein